MSTNGKNLMENKSHDVAKKSPRTPKRLRTSIRFDPIHPSDYLKYDIRSACEDCSHFDFENNRCTLGYDSKWHRKDFQKSSYELTGRMALCRFLEID